MNQTVLSPGVIFRFKALPVALLLLAALLAGTTKAHAVCEELLPQMFTRTLDLGAASQDCHRYIENNVRNYASAAALIEICRKKTNFSRRYKNRVYAIAHRCVEKKSRSKLVRIYDRTRSEQLKILKADLGISISEYCRQKEVRDYMDLAEKALSKVLSDAKSNCN